MQREWVGMAGKVDAPGAGEFAETFGRMGERGEAPRASKPEDTASNPPPTRRAPQRVRPAAAPARRPARTNPKPVSVTEGDSHIPTFGTWNVDGDQNFTGIFQAASRVKKGEAGGPVPEPDKASGGSGDLYKPYRSKKRSSPWCCFGA